MWLIRITERLLRPSRIRHRQLPPDCKIGGSLPIKKHRRFLHCEGVTVLETGGGCIE